MNRSSPVSFVVLMAGFLLLAACGRTARPVVPDLPAGTPEAVYRETDRQGPLVLLEGARRHGSDLLPDGRVWLLDERDGRHRLVTPESRFGNGFFASGGTFVEGGVVVHVNRTNEPDLLYEVGWDGHARLLATGKDLGLDEIDPATLDGDGRTLRFRGARVLGGPEGEGLERGLYSYELGSESPPRLLGSLARW